MIFNARRRKSNTPALDAAPAVSAVEVQQIEEKISDGMHKERARTGCGCQLFNLVYVGAADGLIFIWESSGYSRSVRIGVSIGIVAVCSLAMWGLYRVFIYEPPKPTDNSQQSGTFSRELGADSEANASRITYERVAFNQSTFGEDEKLRFSYRWEALLFPMLFGLVWICFVTGMTFVSMTVPALIAWANHKPVKWEEVLTALPFQLAGIFLVKLAFYLPLVQITTRYSLEGIHQYTWRGPRFVKWSEITQAELQWMQGAVIRLHSPEYIVRVDLNLYRKPKTALEEIKKRIPVPLEKSTRLSKL